MSLSSNALATLEAVKAYLKINTETDNELLIKLINSASTAIESYCGRKFKEQT